MGKLNSVKVGIIGGTGYTGMELLRILASHPHAQVVCITSRSETGNPVAGLFPSLRGVCGLKFTDPENSGLNECDVVFSAAPSGVAMTHVKSLLASGIKLIDLSADFRLKDVNQWEEWYSMKHECPELIAEAVYGLPEVNRKKIQSARLLANPGCYPTAIQLGFLPLIENKLIELDSLIADAKSGVSGAGRKVALSNSFCEVSDSFRAYSASGHRHLPEIKQGLGEICDHDIGLVFTPHLLPIIRGIHATLYGRMTTNANELSNEEIQNFYEERYQLEPFVEVLPFASHPDTRSVRGGNMCRISLHRPDGGRNIVVLAVEDNLVKGAAGQAIQNMNLMCGYDETCGLTDIALVP